jgi:hypothetical protein
MLTVGQRADGTLNAYNVPSPDATYRTPSTTAGDEYTLLPVVAVHSGLHRFGVPLQFISPAASYAFT